MNLTVTDGLGDMDDDLAWLSSISVIVESTMPGTSPEPLEIADFSMDVLFELDYSELVESARQQESKENH